MKQSYQYLRNSFPRKLLLLVFFAASSLLSNSVNAQSWQPLGPDDFSQPPIGSTMGDSNSLAIAPDGTPHIAYSDSDKNGKATVKKFNGSSWVTVGTTGFSADVAGSTNLAISADGTLYIGYWDTASNGKATVKKFNGTSWVNVGAPGFSTSEANYFNFVLAPDGTPYICYSDSMIGNRTTVMKFNGTSWVIVGAAGFSASEARFTKLAIAPDGTPYIAYSDFGNSNKATVKKFDGVNWVTVSTAGFSEGYAQFISLTVAPDGKPYIGYRSGGYKATVMKFNGTNWVTVGAPGLSETFASDIDLAIAPDGVPYIGYKDYNGGNENATVKKFDGAGWETIGSVGFSAGMANFVSLEINPDGNRILISYTSGSQNNVFAKYFNITSTQPCSAPVAATTQYLCEGNTISNLTATGTNIKWYANATGGQALSPQDVIEYGTYYVTQTTNGCESSRVAVLVYIMYKPQITVYYIAEPSPLVNNGIERWYTAPEGGTPLPDGTILVQGNYYVSGYTQNCETARVTRYVLLNPQVIFYEDNDLDGFGNPDATIMALNPPTNFYSLMPGDCDDADPAIGNCLEIPFTKLEGQYCAAFLPALNTTMYAEAVVGATKYRFWVIDGDVSEVVEKSSRNFKLTELNSYKYSHTYNVRVSARVGGEWTPYGITCPVITPASPITKIKAAQCGRTVASLSTIVYADAVTAATAYRFRISRNGSSTVLTKTTPSFRFNELSGVEYAASYTIDVAVQLYGEWSFYGSQCVVTTSAMPVTQISTALCGTVIPTFGTPVYADGIDGATQYRFRITDGSNVQVIDRSVRYFTINQITGYSYAKTYAIEVAAFLNGQWTPYGTSCNITTPALPITQVSAVHCGTTVSFTTNIYADVLTHASGYRFRITDGANVQFIEKASRYFTVNEISGYAYNKTYGIAVAVRINGQLGDYGSTCTINTTVSPTTQLDAGYCGATMPSIKSVVYAKNVSQATGYRFRIMSEGNVYILENTSRYFILNHIPGNGYGKSYSVDVAVQHGGSWGSYGDVCTVSTPPAMFNRDRNIASENIFEAGDVTETIQPKAIRLTAYPNPYTENFTVEMITESLEKVTVRAFDMTGKLVEDITVLPSELTSQKLGSRYADGVYNVMVVQGSYQKTFRIIKK